MIMLSMAITFICIFVAGMNFAAWDIQEQKNNLYISIFCGVVGIFNMVSLVGLITKAVQ